MPEEQRQQQHLDVRAVDVGVAQDADLAVAQARQIRAVVGAVGVDAHRHRDVVDLVVGEQPVTLDLPGVEHLATQRQDRLGLLVAAHLGAAAGRIALDQEHLVEAQVAALAVGQLAGQHGHARALLLLDLLPGLLARLGLADHQFGELLAVFDVLVEPQLQRRAHEGGHQAQCVAAVEPLLGLALELRIEHLGRQHEAGAAEDVVGHQLDTLGAQRVQLDETFHGLEQTVLQARLVGAAGHRRDQVDVALAQVDALFDEGHAPGGALAFGEVLGLAGAGVLLAFEQRDQRLGVEVLHQVVAQAALVEPGLDITGLLVAQRHRHAGHQHRLAAQQVHQLAAGQFGTLEILRIRPDPHRRALAAIARGDRPHHQRLDHVAAGKRQRRDLLVATDLHLQPRRQRIGHAHAHAVQAAREAVGAPRPLVELATRVQPREDDLDHRHLLLGMQAEGDAAAVVLDADRAVGVQRDGDALAVTGQRLVGGVVDRFLHDVQRRVGAGVHARALLDGLEALEHPDGGFGVGVVGFGGRHGGGF